MLMHVLNMWNICDTKIYYIIYIYNYIYIYIYTSHIFNSMIYHGSSFNLTQLPRNALFAWATAAANRVSEKAGVPGRWSFTRKWREAVNIFSPRTLGISPWKMVDMNEICMIYIYIMEIKHQSSTQIWIYHAENLHISGYALVNGDFCSVSAMKRGGVGGKRV